MKKITAHLFSIFKAKPKRVSQKISAVSQQQKQPTISHQQDGPSGFGFSFSMRPFRRD